METLLLLLVNIELLGSWFDTDLILYLLKVAGKNRIIKY